MIRSVVVIRDFSCEDIGVMGLIIVLACSSSSRFVGIIVLGLNWNRVYAKGKKSPG
jgi:hypothetical protein